MEQMQNIHTLKANEVLLNLAHQHVGRFSDTIWINAVRSSLMLH